MKLENVLKMDLEFNLGKEELGIRTSVGMKDDVADLLTDEEVERIGKLVEEISDILNVAITRDLAKDAGISFSHTTKKVIKEDEKLQELYDKLSDEYKAKADKMMEDIEKLKTPEEKAKRVLEEIINDIFER